MAEMPMMGTERNLLAEWFQADREWKRDLESKIDSRFDEQDAKFAPLMETHRQWVLAKRVGAWIGGLVTLLLGKVAWSWIGGGN